MSMLLTPFGCTEGCKYHGYFWAWLKKEGLGWHWVGHFSPPLHVWAYKTHFWPCGPSVSDNIILFLSLHGQSLAESRVYWELVNEWVWFESWIYREWLQGQLGEVLSIITHIEGNWECNSCTLKDPTSSKWVLEIVLLLIGHEIFMCHYQLNLLSTSTVRVYLQYFCNTRMWSWSEYSEGIHRCTICAGHTCRPWQIMPA